MNRSLILFCLVAAFCFAISNASNHHGSPKSPWDPVGLKECREGFEYTTCGGLCRRTCDVPKPAACDERICRSGCVCPQGQVLNHADHCVPHYDCHNS